MFSETSKPLVFIQDQCLGMHTQIFDNNINDSVAHNSNSLDTIEMSVSGRENEITVRYSQDEYYESKQMKYNDTQQYGFILEI